MARKKYRRETIVTIITPPPYEVGQKVEVTIGKKGMTTIPAIGIVTSILPRLWNIRVGGEYLKVSKGDPNRDVVIVP